jgi:phosphoribosylformylglycinamidine synthase PurS subunit
MKAKIKVTLKRDILDPQGKAVAHAANDMKYGDIKNVRIGKYVEIEFSSTDRAQVEKETLEICNKLLANPVIEVYEYEIED